MSDLRYSVQQLTALGGDLSRLAGELGAEARGTTRFGEDRVGHRDVAAALDAFADDWHGRREHLAHRLADLGAMASDSAGALQDTDVALAREVRDAVDGVTGPTGVLR